MPASRRRDPTPVPPAVDHAGAPGRRSAAAPPLPGRTARRLWRRRRLATLPGEGQDHSLAFNPAALPAEPRSRPHGSEALESHLRGLCRAAEHPREGPWRDQEHRSAYRRGRPGPAGTTGEQRVQATRERRATERNAAIWARRNTAALRRIAGQITALTDLPATAHRSLSQLDAALAHDDPAALIQPLNATRPHLTTAHPGLAAQLDTLTNPAITPPAPD
ncbi:type III effector protein [Streptomyces sp. NPDC048595]|uniref:type III effector protein n=1 Tax=Streptomyces sp. NPDC048595 TaxID=3365576 RepID=UPI0037112168